MVVALSWFGTYGKHKVANVQQAPPHLGDRRRCNVRQHQLTTLQSQVAAINDVASHRDQIWQDSNPVGISGQDDDRNIPHVWAGGSSAAVHNLDVQALSKQHAEQQQQQHSDSMSISLAIQHALQHDPQQWEVNGEAARLQLLPDDQQSQQLPPPQQQQQQQAQLHSQAVDTQQQQAQEQGRECVPTSSELDPSQQSAAQEQLQEQHQQPQHIELMPQQQQPQQQQQQQDLQEQQRRQQQQQQDLLEQLQVQLGQCTHWQQLLPFCQQAPQLPLLSALIHAAVKLQRHQAADDETQQQPLLGLAADQRLFEQQQYNRFLAYMVTLAGQLLTQAGPQQQRAGDAAADNADAAAAAAALRDLLLLLECVAALGSSRQQQLHSQLLQLPVSAVIKQYCRLWQPLEALQVMLLLALLKPHINIHPKQQQMLLAAVLDHPRDNGSHSSSSSSSRVEALGVSEQQQSCCPPQQRQQQQVLAVSDVAKALWVTARLSWRPPQQLLQRAAAQVLQELQWCSPSDVAMTVWSLAKLGVTVQELQHCVTHHHQQQYLSPLQQQHADQDQQQQVQGPRKQQQQQHDKPLQLPRVLSSALLRHCRHFNPQECVGVLWGAIELQLLPDAGLLRGVLQVLVRPEVLLQLTDEDITSVLWSLARMHQKRAALLTSTLQQQQQSQPQQQKQQKQKQAKAAKAARGDSQGRIPEQLQLQWEYQALQQADCKADADTVEQLLQHRQQQRQQRAAVHAEVLQQRPLMPPALLQPLLQAYYTRLPACHGGSIARTLWSISVLGALPDHAWMVGVVQRLELELKGLDATSCMLLVLALSRLRFLPHGPWLQQLWQACLPLFPQQQQQQQELPGSSGFSRSVGSSSSRGSSFTQAELIVVATSAYNLSLLAPPGAQGPWKGQKPPGEWLYDLARTSRGQLSSEMDLGTLLAWGEVMMRFSNMAGSTWHGPGPAWWRGFEAATEPYLQAAEPKELLRLAKMLSLQKQHRPVSRSWVDALLTATEACLAPAAWSAGGRDAAAATAAADGAGSRARPGARAAVGPDSASTTVQLSPSAPAVLQASAGLHSSRGSTGQAHKIKRQGKRPLSARNLANLGKAIVDLGVWPGTAWLEAWELALELAGSGMSREVCASINRTRAALAQLESAERCAVSPLLSDREAADGVCGSE